MRTKIEGVLPPLLYKAAAVAAHRWRHDATVFTGRYRSWAEVAAASSGYDAKEILERTRASILKVKADPTQFERDSVILPEPEYSFPALAAILWAASRGPGGLDVVDFGGSLGSSYFQLRRFLKQVVPLRWAVVEQSHFVQCGCEEIAEGALTFHPSIHQALESLRRDLFFASSVLQYLPAPHAFIDELTGLGFDHILIDRTAFHDGHDDRLTLQENPAAIYRASYPAWFFNEERFLASFSPTYDLVYSFDGRDHVHLAGGDPYYRGYLFQRSSLNA